MTEHIPIILRADFPGGNGDDPVEVQPDHWRVEPQGDLIYGPWYYLEVENPTDRDREVRLDVTGIPDVPGIVTQADRPVYRVGESPWFPLDFSRVQIVPSERLRRFEEPIVWFWEREEEVPPDRWRDFPTVEAHLQLAVPAHARIRVATTYPYLNSELQALINWVTHLPEAQRRLVRVETYGRSEQGRPLVMFVLTDPDIPHNQKQVLAITARHHPAMEDSGSWCAEGCIEWLLSGHPRANAALAGWEVIVMPLVNPDAVEAGRPHYNAHGVDLFMDYAERRSAEVRAIMNTLDRFQPDFFMDLHGWILHQKGQPPYDGSYLDLLNSLPWDNATYQAMADFWKERIYGFASYVLYRNIFPNCSAGAAYWEWHTLGIVTEINPGGHSLFQLKLRAVDNLVGALELLERHWPGYPGPGVPNREIARAENVSLFAWGPNLEAIRASRVALWQARGDITLEVLPGRVIVRCGQPLAVPAGVRLPAAAERATVTVNNAPAPDTLATEDGWLFVPVTLDGGPVTIVVDNP
ncbi:MAG: M14 family zinc carboxypeptidase [Candidatus Neomarinimicrobiota bacterium]